MEPLQLIKAFRDHVRDQVDGSLPYWAVVSAVSGQQVVVTATNAATTATMPVAAAAGMVLVGDYGICTPVVGGDWFFVPLESADTANRRGRTPVDVATAAKDATTNTGTYVVRLTTTISPPYGVYGCEIRGSGVLWRSVNSGDKRLILRVGGTNHEVVLANSDGIDLTREHPMSARILRDAASPMTINAGNPSVTITLEYRGGSTAGTTSIVNAELSGCLYRIG